MWRMWQTQRRPLRDGLTPNQFLARHRFHGHETDARLVACFDCEVALVDGQVVDFYDEAIAPPEVAR